MESKSVEALVGLGNGMDRIGIDDDRERVSATGDLVYNFKHEHWHCMRQYFLLTDMIAWPKEGHTVFGIDSSSSKIVLENMYYTISFGIYFHKFTVSRLRDPNLWAEVFPPTLRSCSQSP